MSAAVARLRTARLLARFALEAPAAQLRAVGRPQPAAAQALESGEAELAIGYFPDLLAAGYFQQKRFDNPHVCIVRRGRPSIGPRVTLKAARRGAGAVHAAIRRLRCNGAHAGGPGGQ